MGKCSIKICKNRNDKLSPKKVYTFSFPKANDIRNKWLEICSKTERNLSRSAFICEDHFVETDYKKKPFDSEKFLNFYYSPKRRRIKDDAIPSINLSNEYLQIDKLSTENENSLCPKSLQFNEIPQVLKECGNIDNKKGKDVVLNSNSLQVEKNIHSNECAEVVKKMTIEQELELLKKKLQKVEEETKIKLQKMEQKSQMKLQKFKNETTQKYDSLSNKHAVIQNKYNNLCNKNKLRSINIKNKMNSLQHENNILKKNLKFLKINNKKHQKYESAIERVFTKKQIHKVLNSEKKFVHWDSESIARSITLHSLSGAAYRFMQKTNYPLPSRTCIKRWASGIELNEGINHDVLYMMEMKGNQLEPHQKLVVISWDEVYLSPRIDICKKREQVIGPYKTAQVCMVRGLFMNYKQPIYYKFDQKLTSEILIEVITELWRIGYTVVSIVTDLGGGNPQAFKDYKIGINENEQCFFIHPCDKNHKIFVFADVPHLFKLFRNHFLDDGGYTIREILEDGTVHSKVVNKKVIENIIKLEEGCELRIAHKSKPELLEVKGPSRQKVSSATKLFSKTNSRAIRWYGQENLLDYEDWEVAADVFEMMNDWFDVFNSKVNYGCSLSQAAYGKNLPKQDETLDKVTDLMKVIEFGKKDSLRPFQKGIILNNKSLKKLLEYLKEKHETEQFKISYILTNRLNQDCLENLFSIIRAMGRTNDHPSALEFEHRFKSYILGRHAEVFFSRYKNTEDDNDKSLVGLNEETKELIIQGKRSIGKDTEIPHLIDSNIKDLSPDEDNDDIIMKGIDGDDEISKSIEQDWGIEVPDELQDTSNDMEGKKIVNDLTTDVNTKSKLDCLKDLVDTLGLNENEEWEDWGEEQNRTTCNEKINYEKENNAKIVQSIVHFQSLGFVGGYTAFKNRFKYPYLSTQTSKPGENTQEDLTWLQTLSDGWLCVPSKRWFFAVTIIDEIFDNFHGKGKLSREPSIFSKVTDIAFQKINKELNNTSEPEIPRSVVLHQVKTRSYFRLRHLEKERKENEIKSKLEKKIKRKNNTEKKKLAASLQEQRHKLSKINKFLTIPILPQ